MKPRRWGQRKLTDDAIRRIAALAKTMPRCAQSKRELAKQFHCGFSTVEKIAGGWIQPRGSET